MLKNKNYYNLVKKQLEKDKILENFEKINGDRGFISSISIRIPTSYSSCMRNELILYLESNYRKNEIYDNRTVPVICR